MNTLLTIPELSKKIKLSEIAIYKMLKRKSIPGIRVGKLWRFDEEEIQRWLKDHSSLPEQSTTQKPPHIEKLLNHLNQHLKKQFGKKYLRLVLYGSWARQTATEQSDVDALVIVSDIKNPSQIRQKVHQIAYEVSEKFQHKHLIAITLMTENEYLTGSSALLMNIRKEGRVIHGK
ncbi:MAG: hypothetical protein ACD_62C00461G0003 [uncultured bacterium]|nr:MAG: hypothetical protein ACD_62C00461G0003 [uncultured bacterium]HLD44138.1 helix-turn-helix domain-containing protein [bacterium]